MLIIFPTNHPYVPATSEFIHCIFLPWRNSPSGPRPTHWRGFMIILIHTTLGRTPLDEWPARRRDLYLTTHNAHSRQTSMPPVGFEPTTQANERPQTHALDDAATGICIQCTLQTDKLLLMVINTIISKLLQLFCFSPSYSLQLCSNIVSCSNYTYFSTCVGCTLCSGKWLDNYRSSFSKHITASVCEVL
jgi:hypothetical protein